MTFGQVEHAEYSTRIGIASAGEKGPELTEQYVRVTIVPEPGTPLLLTHSRGGVDTWRRVGPRRQADHQQNQHGPGQPACGLPAPIGRFSPRENPIA